MNTPTKQYNKPAANKSNENAVYERAVAAAEMILKDRHISARFTRLKNATLKWDSERNYAIKLIQRNEKLAATVSGNPLSLGEAIVESATLGLSLNPTLGHAYLVPEMVAGRYTVTVMCSYKGLEYLVLKSGAVRMINTELVYANDTFERGTFDGRPYVKFIMARGDRGELEGGYCMAKLENGEMQIEWMSADEIEGCHQAAIKKQKVEPFTWKGPFAGEMRKKCIVRRGAKHWVLPDSLIRALTKMDDAEPMVFDQSDEAVTSITKLTEEHNEAIYASLREHGMEDAHITIWIDRQAQAWGHAGIDSFPDDAWEKMRNALLERRARIDATVVTTDADKGAVL